MNQKHQPLKILALSDLHGYLPEVPDCDLLLLAGDYSPTPEGELQFLHGPFRRWIDALADRMKIVAIAGNHDLLFESDPHLLPDLRWTYLQDSGTEFRGLKIYGSPWQPRFFNWAFNLDEPELAERWKLIPEDTDILITHGPPYGILDQVPDGQHVGSPSLAAAVRRVKPKLHIFGHIHHSAGVMESGRTTFVNAAILGEDYRPNGNMFCREWDAMAGET